MEKLILFAEDEANIRKLVTKYLTTEGFKVIPVPDGQEAIKAFDEYPNLSLAILDVMMPKVDGYQVCRYIRNHSDLPVLILTAKDTEMDEVASFDVGADEYISKPFSPLVLVTRVKNLIKRTTGSLDQDISIDNLKVHFRERVVTVNGEKVLLTPKEFDLLYYLLCNKNIVLTRDQIINTLWGYDFNGYDRTIDTHIKCIRAKLGDYGDRIITVRKVGYKFEDKTL